MKLRVYGMLMVCVRHYKSPICGVSENLTIRMHSSYRKDFGLLLLYSSSLSFSRGIIVD